MTTETPRQTDDAPTEPRLYILRVWQEPSASAPGRSWRASVRDGVVGERRFFASIDDCIDHLYGEFSRR